MRILLIFLLFILISCSKEESISVNQIEEKEINLQMIDSYNEGIVALDEQDGLTAAKK